MRKKFLAFDMDGTLTPAYGPMEEAHKEAFKQILEKGFHIAIITGSTLEKVKEQVIKQFDSNLKEFYVVVCNGALCYKRDGENRHKVWEYSFPEQDIKALKEKFYEARQKLLGDVDIQGEDFVQKGNYMISFAVIGKDTPADVKEKWDPDGSKRQKLIQFMKKYFPQYNFYIGGRVSIDVLPKGIDKAKALEKLVSQLNLEKGQVLYFGDSFMENGNDVVVEER
jgi:HAD superfamily hydrolase (TIGR01484 family)